MDPTPTEPPGPLRDDRLAVGPTTATEAPPTPAARAVALLLLGAVLAVVLIRGSGEPGTPLAGSADDATGSKAAVLVSVAPESASTEFAWPIAERVPTKAEAQRESATSQTAQTDVCAPGAASAEIDEAAFARRFAAAGRRARERLLEVLDASQDDRLRIVGLVMRRDADVAAATLPAAIRGESCGRDAVCARSAVESLAEASRVAAAPRTEAIARLASASREPMAYALAVDACAANMAAVAPSCRLVSTEQWARLDADNAVPWLHVAASAAGRRDAAALADAYHRAAQARGNRLHDASLHPLLEASLPADLGASERVQALALAAAAIASSWTVPDHAPALEYCSRRAVLDSNRSQSCDALTTQLADKPGTLLDLAVAIRLAEQLGWPEERIEGLRRQHDALSRVQVEARAEAEPGNCSELAAAADLVARRARLGEIGALREAIVVSGKSIEQLAAEERATRPIRVAEQGPRTGASN